MRSIYRFSIRAFLLTLFLLPGLAWAQNSMWDNVPQEMKERNFFKRMEWFYRQRAAPEDTIPIHHFYAEMEKEKKKELNSPVEDLAWTQVGPIGINSVWPPYWGVNAGRVRGIAVHPQDPNTVYIGAASGGIWKTTDGGENWAFLSRDFATLTFGAIAIDPANPEVVYAGTGEILSRLGPYTYTGKGMYKSTDGGDNWKHIDKFGEVTSFGDVVVNPHNTAIVYAALGSGNSFYGNHDNEGVWKSTDYGESWYKVYEHDNVFDIIVHPTDDNIVYAGVGTVGVVASVDQGETFEASNSGLPGGISRIQITQGAANPDKMYAIIYNGTNTVAYKSVNAGVNWTQISAGVQLSGTYDGVNWLDQGTYDLCIAVNPTNPDDVLAGNVELHRTSNGADFSPVRRSGGNNGWQSPMHTDYHKIVFSPSNPDIIWIGSDGGIWRSTDGGDTWHHRNYGLHTIQFYRIASHPTNPDIIMGGTQDNGNMRTDDRGVTNYDLTTTGDGMECFYDVSNPTTVFMSIQYGALYRSLNNGTFGTFSDISPDFLQQTNWITPYFQDHFNPAIIYAGSKRFWKSTNRGSTWNPISGFISNENMNSVSQSPINSEIFVAAGSGTYSSTPQIFVSSNGGGEWKNVAQNIPGLQRFVPRVLADPYDENTLWVVRSGFGGGKVFKSTNFGNTWTDISGDLPDIPTNDIFVDPELEGHIYLANDFGVYRTVNGGENWTRLGNGIDYVPCMDFSYVVIDHTRYLRVGTHGQSILETILNNSDETYLDLVRPNGDEDWVIGTTQNIIWTSSNAGMLKIEFSKNNGTSWNVIADDINSTLGKYSWDITEGLSEDCLIRVTSRDEPTLVQTSSETFIISNLAAPAIVGPEPAVTNLEIPVTLEWYEANGALRYHLMVSTDDAFSNVILDNNNITDIYHEMTDLEHDTWYYWKVSAVNDAGESPYSEVYSFKTILATPLLTYPSDGATEIPVDVILDWDDVTGAERYLMQVATNSLLLNPFIDEDNVTASEFSVTGLELNKKYYWRVEAKNSDGESNYSEKFSFTTVLSTGLGLDLTGVPDEYYLGQNFPNPFNPSTTISFGVPERSTVVIGVYNMLGERMALLESGEFSPGYHQVAWNASDISSGVYMIRIKCESMTTGKTFTDNIKAMFMK